MGRRYVGQHKLDLGMDLSMRHIKIVAVFALLAASASTAYAGDVTIPNTFAAGTPAKAADVNANFSAVATAVNGTAADVTALQTAVKAIPAGAQGPAGALGPAGPAGPSGPMGLPGATGATGSTGAAGVSGAQGPAGPAGAAGPAGPTGATGPQGPAGSGGVLMVKDANGLTIGQYSTTPASGEFVIAKTSGGLPFVLPIWPCGISHVFQFHCRRQFHR